MATILVLDDDRQILTLTSQMLSGQGHKVLCAESGAGAIDTIKAEKVDIVITDILMPDIDGAQLINQCRKQNIAVKIIAVSGGRRKISAQFNLKSAGLLGADQLLAKPFNQQQLVDKVKLLSKAKAVF